MQARIGIDTGEVVTGTEERLATGDAVTSRRGWSRWAEPGEILIGEATLALVREAVQVEAFEPLELKERHSRCLPTGCSPRGRRPSAGTTSSSSAGQGARDAADRPGSRPVTSNGAGS